MATKTLKSTFRFEREVGYAITDLLAAKYGRDKTEVVSKAILEVRERLGGGTASISAIPATPDSGPSGSSPVYPFRSVCKHGGETFGSFTKFATICPECKKQGHTNNPSECPVCVDRGTGAL